MSRRKRLSRRKIRIAKIPYLNSRPFFQGWPEDFQMISGSPRELGEAAEKGEADAGPLALVDFWRLSSIFESLGSWGISSINSSGSVLLFSKRPLAALAGAHIGVSEETSTSSELLRVLLESRHGVQANFKRGFAMSDDAQLAIGDEALFRREKADVRFPIAVDLGEEWRRWRGLPFVFARWVVRRELPKSSKEEIANAVKNSLERCDLRKIAGEFAKSAGLAVPEGLKYLSGFRYTFTKEEQKAMEAFHDLWIAKVPVCGC